MSDNRTVVHFKKEMQVIEERFNSNTICSAKWLQGTTLLFNGMTHSCHHTKRHKIDPEAVKLDPMLIHNTPEKHEQREKMLNNERPPECSYCWTIEDQGNVSDRHFKTLSQEFSLFDLERVGNPRVIPTYLEVAFDFTCNLKCMYCGPDVSSKWMEEVKRHGAYPISTVMFSPEILNEAQAPIPHNQYNPYIEAFWKWWPQLKNKLKVFRITGGEPLLSKHLWRVLEQMEAEPNPALTLAVNSNFSVQDSLMEKFITHCASLEDKIAGMQVYTSCEAYGAQAEYIRYGMDYAAFEANCYKLLERTTKTSLTFMMTVNSIGLLSLKEFMNVVLALRARFGEDRIRFDLGILRHPWFMDIRLLDKPVSLGALRDLRELMVEHMPPREVELVDRLISYAKKPMNDFEHARLEFRNFYREYDKRRGTDFAATFPQLAEMVAD